MRWVDGLLLEVIRLLMRATTRMILENFMQSERSLSQKAHIIQLYRNRK